MKNSSIIVIYNFRFVFERKHTNKYAHIHKLISCILTLTHARTQINNTISYVFFPLLQAANAHQHSVARTASVMHRAHAHANALGTPPPPRSDGHITTISYISYH